MAERRSFRRRRNSPAIWTGWRRAIRRPAAAIGRRSWRIARRRRPCPGSIPRDGAPAIAVDEYRFELDPAETARLRASPRASRSRSTRSFKASGRCCSRASPARTTWFSARWSPAARPSFRGSKRSSACSCRRSPVRVRFEAGGQLRHAVPQGTAGGHRGRALPPSAAGRDAALWAGCAGPCSTMCWCSRTTPSAATPAGRFRIGDVRVAEHMHYDFSLVIDPGETLLATFTFNRNVISAAEFTRIEREIRALVAAVLADPDQPLDRIDFAAAEPLPVDQPAAAPGPSSIWSSGRSPSIRSAARSRRREGHQLRSPRCPRQLTSPGS